MQVDAGSAVTHGVILTVELAAVAETGNAQALTSSSSSSTPIIVRTLSGSVHVLFRSPVLSSPNPGLLASGSPFSLLPSAFESESFDTSGSDVIGASESFATSEKEEEEVEEEEFVAAVVAGSEVESQGLTPRS